MGTLNDVKMPSLNDKILEKSLEVLPPKKVKKEKVVVLGKSKEKKGKEK